MSLLLYYYFWKWNIFPIVVPKWVESVEGEIKIKIKIQYQNEQNPGITYKPPPNRSAGFQWFCPCKSLCIFFAILNKCVSLGPFGFLVLDELFRRLGHIPWDDSEDPRSWSECRLFVCASGHKVRHSPSFIFLRYFIKTLSANRGGAAVEREVPFGFLAQDGAKFFFFEFGCQSSVEYPRTFLP